MAEYTENLIKFGWLTKAEMEQAIINGDLDEYDLCFSKDTHEQFLISSTLTPIPIKSRLRIYGSAEAAIEDIKQTSQTYAGEIISVRDGEKFIAYVVNQFSSGEWYISPVYSDSMVDYNTLQNTPIKNIDGTVTSPIVLSNLEDGFYKVTGHFITPNNNEITSIVGNYVIVERPNLTTIKIKQISSESITDYETTEGYTKVYKYATEQYITDQGFVTEDELETELAAFKIAMENYIREYVATTCTLLIKELINQELDLRYSSDEDIEDLFN